MPGKTKDIILYIAFAMIPAAAYGLFSYFIIYTRLAGRSMLHSYLWNIAFIIAFLIFDKFTSDILLSKEFVITKKTYFIAGVMHVLSFVSFKTAMYLFYIVVLIASRISILAPDSVPYGLHGFVLSVEYCLILLVVFDKFIEYLLEDGVRMKRVSAKFTAFAAFVAKRAKRNKKGRRKSNEPPQKFLKLD